MVNSLPFDAEEWLNTKKKGISGKVPRADFIVKMKELSGEIERLKKECKISEEQKNQLITKNQELEEQLKTIQTSLNNKEQVIQEKDGVIEEIKIKLTEQQKILQNKEEELKTRPDITREEHQELLNNQEKHTKEDLKPDILPSDWEWQLSEKEVIGKKNQAMENQLKEVYSTYPIILEEEKPENVKKYIDELSKKIEELEQRPTTEQLQQVIQQEADKYKDFVKLEVKEREMINNYAIIEAELEEAKSEISKSKKITEIGGQIITEEEIKKLQDYNILKIELEQLKEKLVHSKINQPTENKEMVREIREIFTTSLNPLQIEISELTKNIKTSSSPEKSPFDYQKMKEINKELYRILGELKDRTDN